jgi:hypothetical protein
MNYSQIVRRTLALLEQGDPRDRDPLDLLPMIAIADTATEWDVSGAICDGATHHGRQGIVDFFRGYLGTWDEWRFHTGEVAGFGGVVLARAREEGVSRGTGVRVTQTHWQVWSFEGLRLVRWQVFMCLSDALEVVRGSAHLEAEVA